MGLRRILMIPPPVLGVQRGEGWLPSWTLAFGSWPLASGFRLLAYPVVPWSFVMFRLRRQFSLSSRSLLQVRQLPSLVEDGFLRTVEAEEREPRLAGRCVDPVGFLAGWRHRPEVDIHRPIGILLRFLVRIDFDAGRFADEARRLKVVYGHGPKLLCRYTGWHNKPVRVAAIQASVCCIGGGAQIEGRSPKFLWRRTRQKV